MPLNGEAARSQRETTSIVGRSSSLQAALRRAAQYAGSNIPVLIVGETGTGKELFARHIHELSARPGRLVDVDCGALPGELVEALLFGRRRGAYTGAHESVPGLVEEAHRGTLFLDELASLPPAGQRKLLRVLENGEVRRVGDTVKRRIDFRLVSAVQPDFPRLLDNGTFRFDLFQRTAGVVVTLPPLGRRVDDIVPLAQHFAALAGTTLAVSAGEVLTAHPWPGNVRELRSTIDRAACLSAGCEITNHHIREALRAGPATLLSSAPVPIPLPNAAPDPREALISICRANGGDANRIAAALGIGRATLFRRLRQAGVSLRQLG